MEPLIKKFSVLLAATTILAVIFIPVSKVYSVESTAPRKALEFLSDVAKLDLSRYNTTLVSDFVEYPSDYGDLAKESVYYILESDESKITVPFAFVNNTLAWCSISVVKGSPLYSKSQPSSVLDSAKELIQRYQDYSEALYLSEMQSILNTVTELKTTATTAGNLKLEIAGKSGDSSFDWFYTSNGIDFGGKGVHLQFQSGHLRSFSDGWFYLKIGSDSMNISAEEAIRIAREAVPKNYSYEVTLWNGTVVEVTGLNPVDEPVRAEQLIGTREPLTLYPCWHVHLYFDKVYLSNIYGWDVYVWADTGEVIGYQTKKFMGDLPSEADPSSLPSETEPSTSIPEDSTPTQPSDTPPQQTETTPTPPQSPTQTENIPESPTAIYIAIAATVISIPIAIAAITLKKRRK